jgi:hypothetical protein
MRKLFPIIFILCIAGAWMAIIYRNISVPKEYENVLSGAIEACEAGYYLEAQERLDAAAALRGIDRDYRAQELQRDIYYGLQNGSSYERQVLSMIQDYPEQEENYERLIRFYVSTRDTAALCRLLPEYLELWPENESILIADEELDKQYRYVMSGYYDVRYATPSLVDIQESEYEITDEEETVRRKLVNSQGNDVFDAGYSQMSVSQDGTSCFVCDQNGVWTRVDIAQNLLARNPDVDFSYVGRLSVNNIATAIVDGKYCFINDKMKVSDLEWEEAGTFRDGINAVKRNGKWALVTTQTWGDVTEFPYVDIQRNSQDCCVADGYAVVADERGYYVISAEDFLPVSENIFEEMKAFECSQPAAYRSGEKWGFVNRNGEVYLEACYEDAKSYINGYAAVKQGGLWGYIDRDGTMAVEPQFQDALNVMENGYAYVKNEFGYWDYVIIDRLYYADRG